MKACQRATRRAHLDERSIAGEEDEILDDSVGFQILVLEVKQTVLLLDRDESVGQRESQREKELPADDARSPSSWSGSDRVGSALAEAAPSTELNQRGHLLTCRSDESCARGQPALSKLAPFGLRPFGSCKFDSATTGYKTATEASLPPGLISSSSESSCTSRDGRNAYSFWLRKGYQARLGAQAIRSCSKHRGQIS